MGVTSEESVFSFPKNLSVWWSEETEYVLQRIERWAAYARGYNRLRSVRLSPGRMTMQDEPESRWSINQRTNRLEVESGWAPSFRVSHPRRSAPAEQSRLRCCGHGYKSNGNLDSNCLEAYSLDHSIYFKTIGELRNEGKSGNNNSTSCNSGETTKKSTPIDCGDFLSSDFDDEEDELADVDFNLREQLEQLAYGDSDDDDDDSEGIGRPKQDVIQVCRSVINEDEINNNIMRLSFPRQFAAPPAVKAQ